MLTFICAFYILILFASQGEAIIRFENPIVFVSNRGRTLDTPFEVSLMGPEGGNMRVLISDDTRKLSPTWSPDGRIAFTRFERRGMKDIYIMNPDGTGLRRLTNHPMDDCYPAWSSDGRWVAFQTNRDGNWEIYITDPYGRMLKNLSRHPASDTQPCWSPDGKRIAFISSRGEGSNIFIMDVSMGRVINLTGKYRELELVGGFSYPAWSPDGKWIAFSGYVVGVLNWDIYIIDTRGEHLRKLTSSPHPDVHPT